MKAIIVEKESRHVIALTKKGGFIRLRDKGNYQIGQEIDIASGSSDKNMWIRIGTAAAAVLVFLGISFGAYSYAMPYSYINIDINPSIEITMNMYDRVINTKALNDDGERILSSVSAGTKRVEDVIGSILKSAEENGYLGEESENAVMFTVSAKSERKAEVIEEKIENTAGEHLDASDAETEIIVESIPLEKHATAEEMGMSPGKVVLLEKLQESTPEVDMESYRDAPVEEILKEVLKNKTADNEKAGAYENPGRGNDAKGNNGQGGKSDKKKDSKSSKNGKAEGGRNSSGSLKYYEAESEGKGKKIKGRGKSTCEDSWHNPDEMDSDAKNSNDNNTQNNSRKDTGSSKGISNSKGAGSSKDTSGKNTGNGINNSKNTGSGKDIGNSKGAGSSKDAGSSKGINNNRDTGNGKDISNNKNTGNSRVISNNKDTGSSRNTGNGKGMDSNKGDSNKKNNAVRNNGSEVKGKNKNSNNNKSSSGYKITTVKMTKTIKQ